MSPDPKSDQPDRNDTSDRPDGAATELGPIPSVGLSGGPWDDELPQRQASAEPAESSAVDPSLGERVLDLGAIARSMSSISRPSPRRENGLQDRGALPPNGPGSPVLPPTPRAPGELDDEDRGVSVPLPPGLLSVARPSSGVVRDTASDGDGERVYGGEGEIAPADDSDFLADGVANLSAADEDAEDDSGAAPWRAPGSEDVSSVPRVGPFEPNLSELPIEPETLVGGDIDDEFLWAKFQSDLPPAPPQTSTPVSPPDPNEQAMFGIGEDAPAVAMQEEPEAAQEADPDVTAEEGAPDVPTEVGPDEAQELNAEPAVEPHVAEFERGDETEVHAGPVLTEESDPRQHAAVTAEVFAVSALFDLPLVEPSARAELQLDPATAHHASVWMNDEERFDALVDSLRKAGRWPALAAVLAAVIDEAPFASGPRRVELLRELGALGRDRLAHDALAEESFVALLGLQPGDEEACQHLLVLYESRSDVRSRTVLEFHSVPGLGSSAEQLARTVRAATTAEEQLHDPDLAIAGWEQLLSLGRHAEECTVALGRLYRLRSRWDSLAALVDAAASRSSGGARWLALRALADIHSRARGDAEGAANALQAILSDRSQDLPARLMLVEQLATLGDIDALAALSSELGEEPTPSEVRAVRRRADLLWEHGRHKEASEAYEALVAAGCATSDEQDRIDQWRAEVGLHALRVEELESRAATEGQAAALLARAAEVSAAHLEDFERATRLMRSAVELRPSPAGYHRLRDFSARAGLVDERRIAINACLAGEIETAERVALLIELADCEEPVDRAAARAALRRAVDLSADSGVRERLFTMCMHDDDRQAALELLQTGVRRSTDAMEVAELRARIGELLADDTTASIDAWHEVLVYRPSSTDALRQLVARLPASSAGRGRALALASQLHGSSSGPIEHMLEVASAWQDAGGLPESAGVLEQVLALDPGHTDALDALVNVYETASQPELARVALEAAAFHAEGGARVDLLRRAQALLPEDAVAERWSYERRICWLSEGATTTDDNTLALAEKAGQVGALVSLRRHGWVMAASEERQALSDGLVGLLTGAANDPRAALAHARARVDLRAAEATELEAIRGLCALCDDYSSLLELLEQGVAHAGTDEERSAALDALADELLRLERGEAAIEVLHRAVVIAGDDETRMARIEEVAQLCDLPDLRDQVLLEVAITADGARRAALINQWADSPVHLSSTARFARRMLAVRLAGLTEQRVEELSADGSSLSMWPWVCAYLEADARGRGSESDRGTALQAVASAMSAAPECADRELELHGELLLAEPASVAHATALVERSTSLGRQSEARRWLRGAAEKSDDATAIRLLESAWSLSTDTMERGTIAQQMLLHDPDHGEALGLLADLAEQQSDHLVLRDVLLRQAAQEDSGPARARLLERAAAVSATRLEQPRRAIELYDEAAALDVNAEASSARVALVETHGTQQERLELARMRAHEDGESAVERLLELVEMQRAHGALDDALDSLTLAYEAGADVWDELSAELERAGRMEALLERRLQRARGLDPGAGRGDAFGDCLALLASDAAPELREEVLREATASEVHGARARAALMELLLSSGRYEELRDGLLERAVSSSAESRIDLQIAVARIQQFNLQQADASLDLWLDVQGENPENTTSLLALASLAELREDYARAFDWRYQYAHLLVPRDGALALCALAEYCDDHKVHTERVADLYREARRLDPWCTPSSEALKGISRRLSTLRPKAALLEEDGESGLTATERAARLHELSGEQTEVEAQVELLRRSVALDPVRWQAWQRLSELDGGNSPEDDYRYRLAAWNAWRISQPLGEEQRPLDVELGWSAATAANRAGDRQAFLAISEAIHLIAPSWLPAAQAIARAALERDDAEAALTIVSPLVERARESAEPALLSLLGDIYEATGDTEQARTWHQRAVELLPLSSSSLAALARDARRAGDFAGYHNLVLGSLTGEAEPEVHAERLYELAQELEARNESAEATACYEEAFTWGCRDPELLERLYAQYRTQAAGPRGRAVIEALLQSGIEAERARVLHFSLGRLLLEQGDDPAGAIVHLQAVLDADDEADEARSLLVVAFEKSGDDAGLRRVLEELAARASGRPAADAWLRLGAMHAQAGDTASEVMCIERSVEAFPTASAMRTLETAWSQSEPDSQRRRSNLARLAEVDEVCWPHVLEAARPALDADPMVGWCALSPLLMTRSGEDELRSRLREMRRDYERPPIRVAAALAPCAWLPAQTSDDAQSVIRALQVLESHGLRLHESAADAGADEVFEVSPHSNVGRTFLAMAAELGLSDVCLYRAGVLPQSFMHWHSGSTLNVVVRADVFQSMARAEVGFVLVGLLAQATCVGHSLAGLSPERQAGFGAAVTAWLQGSLSPSADERVSMALSGLPDDAREAVAALAPSQLWSRADVMTEAAFALTQQVLRRALIGGPDLYQAGRALARMNDDTGRATSYADMGELDSTLLSDAHLRLLAAFSVTEAFCEALHSAAEVSI